jgi:hypothetical protein
MKITRLPLTPPQVLRAPEETLAEGPVYGLMETLDMIGAPPRAACVALRVGEILYQVYFTPAEAEELRQHLTDFLRRRA